MKRRDVYPIGKKEEENASFSMRIFKGHTVYSVVYTSSRHRYIKNKKNWMTTLKFYWRRGERNEGKDAWACVCNISSSFSRRLKVSRILDTSEIHSNLKRDSAYIVNGGWCTEWKNVRYRVCVLMIRRLCSSLYSNPLETGWGGGGQKSEEIGVQTLTIYPKRNLKNVNHIRV